MSRPRAAGIRAILVWKGAEGALKVAVALVVLAFLARGDGHLLEEALLFDGQARGEPPRASGRGCDSWWGECAPGARGGGLRGGGGAVAGRGDGVAGGAEGQMWLRQRDSMWSAVPVRA